MPLKDGLSESVPLPADSVSVSYDNLIKIKTILYPSEKFCSPVNEIKSWKLPVLDTDTIGAPPGTVTKFKLNLPLNYEIFGIHP